MLSDCRSVYSLLFTVLIDDIHLLEMDLLAKINELQGQIFANHAKFSN